ncbi:hypothetical protein [Actinomadura sp. 9N407]|uniref:hypothetical protein n=1 Tax=Actinomadura sp. 9N407 TaxID=3375154 RepID=UPI0037B1FF3D
MILQVTGAANCSWYCPFLCAAVTAAYAALRDTFWGAAAGTVAGGRAVFAGAGNDHLVYVWDAGTGRLLGEPLVGHGSSVKAVATFRLPGGGLGVASGGDDGTVRLWDAEAGTPVAELLTGHDGWFTELTTLELGDGCTMVAAG